MMYESPRTPKPKIGPSSRRDSANVGRGAVWFGVLLFGLLVSAHSSEPRVAVSVNGRGASVVFRGTPVLITGVFVSAGGADCSAPPVLLAADTGPWTNAVTVEIRNAIGEVQSWPLHTAITPSNSITLDCGVYAQIDWWLTPAETSLLSTGSYTVGLVLNTTNAVQPGAWKGVLAALPANLEIIDEPATLMEAQAENKYSRLALYHFFLGNGPTALDQIESLLAGFPTNITGLRIKSMVLDSLGRTLEAYRVCEQALTEVYAINPDPQEPPVNLLELRSQLETTLLAPPALEWTLTNEQILLSWSGYPGLSYRLETSSDLSAWSLLTTNFTAVSNRFSFTVETSLSRQFFRVAR